MKLRIRDNSIRLRLTQTEVDLLKREGFVTAQTGFADGQVFGYTLESSPASVKPEASFSKSGIAVRVPESEVLAWSSSNQVSMSGSQQLDDGQTLAILVEKDFACLAPREGEDESDMFPHPSAESASC